MNLVFLALAIKLCAENGVLNIYCFLPLAS
nr:MAG TPA: hypothetical protein [Caudoviricetes sp.]